MNYSLSLAAILCLLVFFSCTSQVEPPPYPPDESTTCPADGELSDICPPFFTPSSSSLAEGSSSPSQIGQSSSGEATPNPYSSNSDSPSIPSSSSVSVLPSSSSNPSTPPPPTTFTQLTAIIYDTDASVHPDFSCALWDRNANEGNGPDIRAACDELPNAANLKPNCSGVVRGLVKKTLDPDTRKIECDNCTKNGCWTGEEWFDKAFKATPGVNVELCYNIPFTQSMDGRYEFDSNKMLNANGKLVGGFFPDVLNTDAGDVLNTDAGLAQGDYSQCPSCKTKRTADRFLLIDSTKGGWEQWTTTAQYNALVNAIYEYQSKEGDFANADKPNKEDILPAGDWGCGIYGDNCALYDWTCRRTASCSSNTGIGAGYNWYLYGSTAIKNTYGSTETTFKPESKANQHFCFESHANFVYSPEQVFYIMGDDDLWVYINNQLVIDLGGNHVPAPDHVDLSTLKLVAGETYPLDIFFCDRRTTQASLRISTNITLTQTAEQKGNCYITP